MQCVNLQPTGLSPFVKPPAIVGCGELSEIRRIPSA